MVAAVATFDAATGNAQVKQYGQRLGMRAFAPFFEAADDGKKVADLKDIYVALRQTYTDLAAPGTKDAMVQALCGYEAARPSEYELIPSEDQVYGFSRGANCLENTFSGSFCPP